MCYVGRLKGSMYLVNARLVVRIAAKADPLKDKVLSPGPRGGRVGTAEGFQEGPVDGDPWI